MKGSRDGRDVIYTDKLIRFLICNSRFFSKLLKGRELLFSLFFNISVGDLNKLYLTQFKSDVILQEVSIQLLCIIETTCLILLRVILKKTMYYFLQLISEAKLTHVIKSL